MLPTPGQIVRARSRQYLVEDVVPPPSRGDDTLVRLSCLDDDAQGDPLDVLWERELDAELITERDWHRAAERGFDAPTLFAAYLHALRWGCVTATTPRLFQAPYRAGIEVMAYQLDPLRKALQYPFVNLFIADDTGLGKTIEAGLVVRELMMRQKVRRVVVAAPPSVVPQWRDELERRFGLTFHVYDRSYLLARRRERGYGVNPFTTHSRFVISHALLRDPAHAALLRDWITNDDHLRLEHREPALLILDEAHNAAPASGARYAIDSRFTRAIRELAPLFEHRLFLSATPHNGHSNSFSALLEILEPHRFCRGVKVAPRNLDAVMVRRLKDDLRAIGADAGVFPRRVIEQLDIEGLPPDAPELTLPALLDEYREVREAKLAGASKTARNAATIVLTALQKRLLSSIEAFACTLRVHRRAVERARAVTPAAPPPRHLPDPTLFDPPDADDERADVSEEDLEREHDTALADATAAALSPAALDERETALLERMTAIAEQSRGLTDPRVARLLEWLRTHALEADGTTWARRRVLIFTEYADTKRYLDEQLRSHLAHTDRADERIALFHGGMDDERREEVKRAFNTDPADHPLRILIATDAAREGVNLQNHCADLFHFDVPWNPGRLEQRNGRIDRKLQREPVVRCHYFVLTQRPEDDVIRTLVRKTKTIQSELGSLSPVLAGRLTRMLDGGFRRRDAHTLAAAITAEDLDPDRKRALAEDLDADAPARQQALLRDLDELRKLAAESRDALGFDEDAFRGTLSTALTLAGAEPLTPLADHAGAYTVPVEGTALARDRSWNEPLDTLRLPRPRGMASWDWRHEFPVRPVVFKDVGSLDERFVHLHLEHRLAQRLLGRFTSQGFVHDDLARATAVLTDDPIPRVALLGRLSLYGEGAARLHDEIVAVTARWSEPAVRREALKPYAADAKTKTLALVEDALAAAQAAPAAIATKLATALARDLDELRPHLDALAGTAGDAARAKLATRAEKESRELTEVLGAQRKRIADTLAKSDTETLPLPLDADERAQYEADRKHWRKRISEIEQDLADAPARIRRGYDVRAHHLDLVGVVYLWPRSG